LLQLPTYQLQPSMLQPHPIAATTDLQLQPSMLQCGRARCTHIIVHNHGCVKCCSHRMYRCNHHRCCNHVDVSRVSISAATTDCHCTAIVVLQPVDVSNAATIVKCYSWWLQPRLSNATTIIDAGTVVSATATKVLCDMQQWYCTIGDDDLGLRSWWIQQ
jgi:hypothetical protein